MVEEKNERTRLLTSVLERVLRFSQQADNTTLLDASGVQEAETLAALIEQDDLEARVVLSYFHLDRAKVLGPEQGEIDLRQAISQGRIIESVDATLVPPQLRPLLGPAPVELPTLLNEALMMIGRGEQTADLEMLDEGIGRLALLIKQLPGDHTFRAAAMTNLGLAFRGRFKLSGDPSDLEDAVEIGHAAVDNDAPDDPHATNIELNYAGSLWLRHSTSGRPEDLDEAIGVMSKIFQKLPSDHPHRADMAELWAQLLQARFNRTAAIEDLDAALAGRRESAAATAPDDPALAFRLSAVGSLLLQRFIHYGQRGDLDAAERILRTAVDKAPAGHPNRVECLSNLAGALKSRYNATGDRTVLDETVTVYDEALALTPPDHPARPTVLSNFSFVLHSRFELTGDQADLDRAVAAAQDAVDKTRAASPEIVSRLVSLCGALLSRFEIGSDPADFAGAFAAAEKAAGVLPDGHPEQGNTLSNFSYLLRLRFEQTGHVSDLDAAVEYAQRALDSTTDGSSNMAGQLNNLGTALIRRFQRTDAIADLHRAVETGRRLVETSETHPDRGTHLGNAAGFLRALFDRTGDPRDLEEAVALSRKAVEVTPIDRPDRAIQLYHLCAMLTQQFQLTRDRQDLTTAVAAGRASVKATPPGHIDLVRRLNTLAGALEKLFGETGDTTHLDEGVSAVRAAVAATPSEDPGLPLRLNTLGKLLQLRFHRLSTPDDLEEATTAARTALDKTPEDHPHRVGMHEALSTVLHTRYRAYHRIKDLDEAETCGQAAVRTVPAGHAWRANALTSLAATLTLRHEATGDLDAARQAIQCLAETETIETAPATIRLEAGHSRGRLAAYIGDWAEANAGYATAVDLLPVVAWHGLGQAGREDFLRDMNSLASDAAAAALAAGVAPEDVVERLEQSRGLLLAQALDHRTDLTILHELSPELARRMDDVRAELDGQPGEQAHQHRELAREWDSLLARARALPGMADLLRPQRIEQLLSAAAEGPVVIVNVSAYRCDALLVTNNGVRLLELPRLRIDTVIERADLLDSALSTATAFTKEIHDLVADTVAWLWREIAAPIVDALELGTTPRRIWLSPTGPLTFLPLHAALLDHAVCSYTPTLRALLDSRARTSGATRSMLAVAVPDAPNLPPLPYAKNELEVVTGRFTPAHPLIGEDASRAAILSELPRHTHFHFAGHGVQNLTIDDSAALYCQDHLTEGPISAADVVALRLENAELAFLSACETARGNAGLPNEASHLAGAMQLAGFRHVIATQWAISDARALQVSDDVYRLLDSGTGPAEALHAAVNKLRRHRPHASALWAPYLHIGP